MSESISLQAGQGVGTVLELKLGEGLAQNIGDGTFGARTGYTNGVSISAPVAAAVADLNNDGYEDFITGNFQGGNVDINRGGPNGTFTNFSYYNVASTGFSTHDIETVDLNGDGYLDIVSANDSAGTVTVLVNQGDGTFNNPLTSGGVSSARHLTLYDFDGDGKKDIAVTTGYQGVSILKGNGDGTFKAGISYTGITGADSVSMGDVNGDGIMDLAVGGSSGNTAGIFIGNRDGSFASPQLYTSLGARGTTLADFNRDGVLDMVNASSGYSSLSVRLGKGDGTFGAAATLAAGNDPFAIGKGDFNGDGLIDLISSDRGSNTLSIFLGNGDGSFQARTSRQSFGGPEDIVVKDIDHDGVLDLFMGDFSLTSVTLMLGNGNKRAEIGVFDMMSPEGARASMTLIDQTLNRIGSEKGRIGAMQSRIQVAMKNLMTQRENVTVADSRIAEADIAAETALMCISLDLI